MSCYLMCLFEVFRQRTICFTLELTVRDMAQVFVLVVRVHVSPQVRLRLSSTIRYNVILFKEKYVCGNKAEHGRSLPKICITQWSPDNLHKKYTKNLCELSKRANYQHV